MTSSTLSDLDEQDVILLKVIAHGIPAPKGSKKFVGHSNAGKAILVESSKKARPWADKVERAVKDLVGDVCVPYLGPLSVEMHFTVYKPTSAPKRRRTWPITRNSGDLDKLARNTADAIQDAGLFKDDAQIVQLLATKNFPGEGAHTLPAPGAIVFIRRISVTESSQNGILTQ